MTVIILRILFFSLITLGVFILIKGIKLMQKSFNGAILLEIPYTQKNGQFIVSKTGTYAIW